ncbi:MAG: hypothetical protein JKY65_10995 [Planctomycetes bacterium]|nr:hypothetical protein [Planctomycetota bacterium]
MTFTSRLDRVYTRFEDAQRAFAGLEAPPTEEPKGMLGKLKKILGG